jgi:hypothetical protein
VSLGALRWPPLIVIRCPALSMSIDFYVTHADGRLDSIPVTNQKTATHFFAKLAGQHGFRILRGVYPVWVEEADLDQLIHELSIIRDASRAELDEDQRYSPDDRDQIDRRWAGIIEFVRPLANEHGWEISIG